MKFHLQQEMSWKKATLHQEEYNTTNENGQSLRKVQIFLTDIFFALGKYCSIKIISYLQDCKGDDHLENYHSQKTAILCAKQSTIFFLISCHFAQKRMF